MVLLQMAERTLMNCLLVLKMNPILICGAITGNLTCTPGLNGVIDAADSSTPVLGYTVSYAISNVLLTFLGPVIVFTV